MSTACEICQQTDAQFQCSVCESVRYCSRICQRQDWAKHKRICKALWLHETLIRRGVGQHAIICNAERADRTLAEHGKDMVNLEASREGAANLQEFIRYILPSRTPDNENTAFWVSRVPDGAPFFPVGPAGQCLANVHKAMDRHSGGKIVYGWMLRENVWMIEAVPHCVWQLQHGHGIFFRSGDLVNVTQYDDGRGCTFMPNDQLAKTLVECASKVRIVYWKT